MKNIALVFTFFLLISLIGCSSISTSNDYDPSIDFTKYKTYKWFEGDMPADDALGQHPLVKRRLENSVEKNLTAKGFKKSSGDVDFVVILHAGTKEKMQVNTYNYGGYGYGAYGRGWGGYGGMTTTDVNYYDEATLVVDIADVEKKELVWRGSATGVVSKTQKTAVEAQEDSDAVINKILENFPPQKPE